MVTLESTNTVAVIYGIHRLGLPLAGRSVGGVRLALTPVLNIGPGAIAVVNGTEVGEDHILASDDLLEFVRPAGEKGTATSAAYR